METNKYELKQGDIPYIFETKVKGNWIQLSIENPQKKILSRNLAVGDLQVLDKIFNSVKTPLEGLELIDKVLKEHKVAIFEENENIKLMFYIKTDNIIHEISINFGEEFNTINTNIEIPIETNTEKDIIENTEVKEVNTNLEVNLPNNEILANTVNTTIVSTTNNFDKILPTKYLPTQIINSTEEIKSFNTNAITSTIETKETMITKAPIILPTKELTATTTTNTIYENDIRTSFLPSQTYTTHTYENKAPIIRNSIELKSKPKLELPIQNIIPKKEIYTPNPLNEMSSLISELNKLKEKEIQELKNQISRMRLMKEQNSFDELRKKEEENEMLRKKLEESEKNKKQYEEEINSLRATMKSNVGKKGLSSKNITFEDKSEKIRIKGSILHSPQELEMISRKINTTLTTINKRLTLNLIYKATADSDKASAFHSKCDEANKTLVLIETDKNKRFGGYTSKTWEGDNIEKKDENAFVFSLDKMQIYDIIQGEDAIGCYPKYGPVFLGCQIRIFDEFFTNGGTTYEKGLNYDTQEDFELSGGLKKFEIKEIEVYGVHLE